ncbi:MAG: hypothetical protein H6747_00950 [Deltaproteobacteria bacterium]|nr:hypothetical protein [Deltaproteobacteria bacterium]
MALGHAEILVHVRNDLDDVQALRLAIASNAAGAALTDLDRARLVLRLRRRRRRCSIWSALICSAGGPGCSRSPSTAANSAKPPSRR